MQDIMPCNWDEFNVNRLASIDWRASLVPAAAVIPAPVAYINVVAVKKLVVGFLADMRGPDHFVELSIAVCLLSY